MHWFIADSQRLPDADRRALRRTEVRAWATAAVSVLAYGALEAVTSAFVPSAARPVVRTLAVGAIAALATAAAIALSVPRLAADLRVREAARRSEEQAARLAGALLAAQTIEHHLNNLLSLTTGYGELLVRDPRLPEDLRAQADEARRGAAEAAAVLGKLIRIVSVQEDATLGHTLIDVERSTGGDERSSRSPAALS